jgi:hypothetical protein
MAPRDQTVNAARKAIDEEIAELRRDYYDCLLREAELKVKVVESYEAYQCAVGKIRAYELIEGFLKKEFKHLDEEDE